MTTNSAVWQEIRRLLPQGLSVIPVRDRDDGNGKAKQPFSNWKKYQSQQILEAELYAQLDQFNTSAIAIIAGRISGNLEVIDIDVKHHAGIDAELFAAIRDIYPDIWRILRIHKTPSGGYHILYKVIGQDIPGNMKLAERETTDEERLTSKTKKTAFIETRGEGGYVLAPPSMGYAIFQNNDIPIITWEDRCSIINIAKSFDKIPKEEKAKPKASKFQESYYDEDPFAHYNKTADLLTILESKGWTFVKTQRDKIWLGKPGGKKNDVHGAIFLNNNLFYCFTTSVDFEAEKAYSACNILHELDCDKDWKKVYKFLVEHGYGKIKLQIEQNIVKSGKELPPNASKDAIAFEAQYKLEQTAIHPHGVYWLYDEKDKMYISREHLYNIAAELGFRLYGEQIYQLNLPFAYKRTVREFYDTLKEYIKEEDGDTYVEICNTYEAFLRHNGKFTSERLPLIKEEDIECDSRNTCYKYYKSNYLEITKELVFIKPYSKEQKIIFADKVQQREYKHHSGGIYKEFVEFALGVIDENVKNTIGFLSHEYKDETTAYIVVFVEKCADPKQGGGSGKNVFVNLLSNTTSVLTRPGSGAKFDEKFFQSWNGQRIFAISDVDPNFNFGFLKEPAGGHMLWKRLFSNETAIDASRSPKLIVLTNYSYEVTDGGLRRRIIPIEFTDYFTVNGGVDGVFEKHFPKDWSEEDWNGYDTFISECIQNWLRSNRKLKAAELSLTGWEKQFIQTHKQTIWDIVHQFWEKWTAKKIITNDEFKQDLENFYSENGILISYRPSVKNINKAIVEYAAKMRIFVDVNYNTGGGKGKLFQSFEEKNLIAENKIIDGFSPLDINKF
jgi:hypothetical protein